jgi:hypothetical protein
MPNSEPSSLSELTIGHPWRRHLGTIEAQELRNQHDYDDWEVGLEPIPGDTHWIKITTLTQLYRHMIYVFATCDTISSTRLAKLAINEILKLRLTSLISLRQQDPKFFA